MNKRGMLFSKKIKREDSFCLLNDSKPKKNSFKLFGLNKSFYRKKKHKTDLNEKGVFSQILDCETDISQNSESESESSIDSDSSSDSEEELKEEKLKEREKFKIYKELNDTINKHISEKTLDVKDALSFLNVLHDEEMDVYYIDDPLNYKNYLKIIKVVLYKNGYIPDYVYKITSKLTKFDEMGDILQQTIIKDIKKTQKMLVFETRDLFAHVIFELLSFFVYDHDITMYGFNEEFVMSIFNTMTLRITQKQDVISLKIFWSCITYYLHTQYEISLLKKYKTIVQNLVFLESKNTWDYNNILRDIHKIIIYSLFQFDLYTPPVLLNDTSDVLEKKKYYYFLLENTKKKIESTCSKDTKQKGTHEELIENILILSKLIKSDYCNLETTNKLLFFILEKAVSYTKNIFILDNDKDELDETDSASESYDDEDEDDIELETDLLYEAYIEFESEKTCTIENICENLLDLTNKYTSSYLTEYILKNTDMILLDFEVKKLDTEFLCELFNVLIISKTFYSNDFFYSDNKDDNKKMIKNISNIIMCFYKTNYTNNNSKLSINQDTDDEEGEETNTNETLKHVSRQIAYKYFCFFAQNKKTCLMFLDCLVWEIVDILLIDSDTSIDLQSVYYFFLMLCNFLTLTHDEEYKKQQKKFLSEKLPKIINYLYTNVMTNEEIKKEFQNEIDYYREQFFDDVEYEDDHYNMFLFTTDFLNDQNVSSLYTTSSILLYAAFTRMNEYRFNVFKLIDVIPSFDDIQTFFYDVYINNNKIPMNLRLTSLLVLSFKSDDFSLCITKKKGINFMDDQGMFFLLEELEKIKKISVESLKNISEKKLFFLCNINVCLNIKIQKYFGSDFINKSNKFY